MQDKLEYFISRTDQRLEDMEQKIDKILAFKFMVLGGSAAVSVLCTIAINLVLIYLKAK